MKFLGRYIGNNEIKIIKKEIYHSCLLSTVLCSTLFWSFFKDRKKILLILFIVPVMIFCYLKKDQLEIKLEDTNKNINHTYAPLGTDCIEYIELDLEYIESIKKKQINVEIKKAD